MRRAIVHIGMPRTGSTSLQHVLATLQPALAGEGVLYPEVKPRSFPWPSPNHQPFGETLDGRRPAHEKAECLAMLSEALSTTEADTVILSYEDFAQQQRRFRVPEILRDVLGRHGFAMDVAVVVKAPSEHLNSLYTHRAQLVAERRSFRAFGRQYWRSGRFDYHALIEPWLAASEGRVAAVPLRDRRSGDPLIQRVIRAMGLEARIGSLVGATNRNVIDNRSPGPIVVEASRRLRGLRAHRQVGVHPREIGHFMDSRAWSRGWDETSFRGDAPEIDAGVDARFAAANDRFAQRLWGAPWSAVAADAPPRPPNELAGRPIPPETAERVETIVRETVAHFGLRRLSSYRANALNRLDEEATRLARLVGYSRWRVV